MGLIDDIRKQKDSWTKRFEEHRQDTTSQDEKYDKKNEKEQILKKRRTVGLIKKWNEMDDLNNS